MREIKFRGRRVNNGKWVYGYYFYLHNHKMNDGSPEKDIHGIFDDSGLSNPVNWEGTIHRASYIEVDPETVGEFTGLLDKNGKEIYEGDIATYYVCETHQKPFIGEVDYDETVGRWRLNNIYESNFAEIYWDRFEVIGNIHENPELIKT